MRPFGSQKQLENRRRKAMKLLDTGISLHEVSRRIGCHASSVMRWRNEREQFGDSGLSPKPTPGRPTLTWTVVSATLGGASESSTWICIWQVCRTFSLISKRVDGCCVLLYFAYTTLTASLRRWLHRSAGGGF